MPVPHLDMKPEGHLALIERIHHLLKFKLGSDLPDVWTIAIANPSTSISDVLAAEVLTGLDLDAVAILVVPIRTLSAEDRSTVAAPCRYPQQSFQIAAERSRLRPTQRRIGATWTAPNWPHLRAGPFSSVSLVV